MTPQPQTVILRRLDGVDKCYVYSEKEPYCGPNINRNEWQVYKDWLASGRPVEFRSDEDHKSILKKAVIKHTIQNPGFIVDLEKGINVFEFVEVVETFLQNEYEIAYKPPTDVDKVREFIPPFRVGRNQQRVILDSLGHELGIFTTGSEAEAQAYCDYLNLTRKY